MQNTALWFVAADFLISRSKKNPRHKDRGFFIAQSAFVALLFLAGRMGKAPPSRYCL